MKKKPRPTKKESLRKHRIFIDLLNRSKMTQTSLSDALRDVVSDYFGLKVGDHVVYVGAEGEPMLGYAGIVIRIGFHFPGKISGNRVLGHLIIRPWKKGDGPLTLCKTNRNDEVVTNRDVLKLVQRDHPQGRKFQQ